MTRLFEQWPWHPLFLKLYIFAPVTLSLLLTGFIYPYYHYYSFITLIIIPVGIFIHHLQSTIAEKIKTLLGCISAQNGQAVEALLIIDNKQSPGIVILRDTMIILIPIDGRRKKLLFTDIKNVATTYNLANTLLFSKTVFMLETQKSSQYIFAVSRSTGTQWSEKLINDARKPA